MDRRGRGNCGLGRLRRMHAALLLTLELMMIAGATTFFLMRTPQSVTAAPLAARLSLELPAGLTLTSEYSAPFAIAPAGSPLVLEANEGTERRLYVRELSEPSLRRPRGNRGRAAATGLDRRSLGGVLREPQALEDPNCWWADRAAGRYRRQSARRGLGTRRHDHRRTHTDLRTGAHSGARREAGAAHDGRPVSRRVLTSLARRIARRQVGDLHGGS